MYDLDAPEPMGEPAKPSAPKKQTSEEIATEGLFIASAATRLAVKNRILVDTLAGNIDFKIEIYVDAAREILLTLAKESEEEVARLDAEMQRARKRRHRPMSMHDYQKADLDNLKHRRSQAELVAGLLRKTAADEDAVRELVGVAHEAAWGEISRNITFNLESEFATVGDIDEDEQAEREERISSVLKIDLPKLERDTKVARKREAAAARRAESQQAGEDAQHPSSTSKRGVLGRLLGRFSKRGGSR